MSGLERLKAIVEETEGAGRIFDLSIQTLIVLSLVSFAVETLPDLSPASRSRLAAFEVFTITVFTLEYVIRVVVADRRLGFVFSFFGLVDLAAILPFYLATGLDLRSVRALRLLRLFRVFKLARYSAAIRRCGRAFVLVREELVLFLCLSGIVLYLVYCL